MIDINNPDPEIHGPKLDQFVGLSGGGHAKDLESLPGLGLESKDQLKKHDGPLTSSKENLDPSHSDII